MNSKMKKISVLIVEDEIIVSKDLEYSLKSLGYNVVGCVATGVKAIELAKKSKPDIILLDIMLKGEMSGIDAAGIISKTLNIPFIYLTAYSEENTIEEAKKTGPYGYIVKPFKEIDIKTAIEMAVHKHSLDKSILEERNLLYKIVESKENNDFVFIKCKTKYVKIKLEEILFIEALKDYVIITTKNNKFTIHSTMKDIELKFDYNNFIRVHRSFIINIDMIISIDHNIIEIENNNKKIPIGGSYKESFSRKMKWV